MRIPVAASLLALLGLVSAHTQDPPTPALRAICPAGLAKVTTAMDGRPAPGAEGSAPIPLDSWVYPAVLRLYGLGYGDSVFLGLRPWTRQSTLHMLEQAEPEVLRRNDPQGAELLDALLHELRREPARSTSQCTVLGVESLYTRTLLLHGTPLADSYHLGQTFANDYGRPYAPGRNTVTGGSALVERGRWSLYLRGELQHAPAATGYSAALADQLSGLDWISRIGPNLRQTTIPAGPVPPIDRFSLMEATAAVHVLGHELSAGKSDLWLGPAQGGALAWSNNAPNIYGVRVDRVEPLTLPLLSHLLGPVRYGIVYGSLKGHTAPNHPYIHAEYFGFHPTANFEFTFARTIIFGGAAHEPVTLGSFLRGFVNVSDTTPAIKDSPADPGARFSDFSFAWRLPGLRRYATFYTDSFSHDDVSPISAPRRAAFRTGVYLPQVPGARRLSLRAEAAVTDPRVSVSYGGRFLYFESIQRQGYTNQGFLLGDPIGREAKGGEFTAAWQLSGNESLAATWRNKKNARDFILGGTTQNQLELVLRKRLMRELELLTRVQAESWKAPVLNKDTGMPQYKTGMQRDLAASFGLTWFPAAGVR